MIVISGMYNASDLKLHWETEHPVKVAAQLHLTEFTLKNYWTYETEYATSLTRSAFGMKFYHFLTKHSIS